MTKSEWRQVLLQKRRLLSASDRKTFSQVIAETLLTLPEWRNAKTIGCYLSLSDEVSTRLFIQTGLAQKKAFAAPVIQPSARSLEFSLFNGFEELISGPHNILQPKNHLKYIFKNTDLMIVPGVGFDLSGTRLGYGGGFYDRYLKTCPALTIGLGFECQLVPLLPKTDDDVCVSRLITEKRVAVFQPPG
jgi:5-formyltetrahydrofolate cyclo-ligase